MVRIQLVGSAEEIAALAMALQERRTDARLNEFADQFSRELIRQTEEDHSVL